MIAQGLGWAFATRSFFKDELASGKVMELDCPDAHLQSKWSVGAVWHIDRPPGPLSRVLINLLAANGEAANAAIDKLPATPLVAASRSQGRKRPTKAS
jgi:DNA-binding transcriptional LysR family regulator